LIKKKNTFLHIGKDIDKTSPLTLQALLLLLLPLSLHSPKIPPSRAKKVFAVE
jgi:hypothetical protein